MKLKLKMFITILVKTEKLLILVVIQLSENFIIIQTKLVVGKIKDETACVPVEEFVGFG